MLAHELLRKFPIISDQVTPQRLEVVLSTLEQTLQADVPGDIVEFGCYIGTTSLFHPPPHEKYTESVRPDKSVYREFHVYDSFEGLPEKTMQDASPAGLQFKAGELNVSKKQLLLEFKKDNLQPPVVHKSWFNGLTSNDVPKHIAFAFLDGDFYESIRDSLQLVWPVLDQDGVITIDDYGREALPGVERAVNEFMQNTPTARVHVKHNIASIKV